MLWIDRRSLIASCVLIALCATAAVRADLAPNQRIHPGSVLPAVSVESGASGSAEVTPREFPSQSRWTLIPTERLTPLATDLGRVHHAQPISSKNSQYENVITIPPGPSSTGLFVSALAGFGVWHLGKNVRKLSLSALPEWYHANGPAQIGHATPLDPDFHYSTQQLYYLDNLPSADATQSSRPPCEIRRAERVRIPRSDFSPNADPRGPPRQA